MCTGILALPARCDPHAPSFSGNDDESLLEFLDHFDVLAQECKLSADEHCRYILKYVDFRTKQLWLTLDGYESRDFQKFRDEIVYQYPYAEKVARRRASQLARRSTDDVDRLVRSLRSPSIDNPTHAIAHPRLPEPSPAAVPNRPAPVSFPARPVRAVPVPVYAVPTPAARHVRAVSVVGQDHAVSVARPISAQPLPAPITRPVHVVSAPIIRREASIVRHSHAVPVGRLDHTAPARRDLAVPAVPLVRVPPIARHAASYIRHDHAVPVHAAPTVCRAAAVARPDPAVPDASRDRPAPVTCPAAPTVRPDHAAPVSPPPFSFRPTFVPIVPSPTSLPFPLCPTPALTASVPARVQPSPIEIARHAVPSVPHEPRKVSSDARHAPVDVQEQVASRLSHRREEAEDVAILKEEGRGQQAVVQPNDDEIIRHRDIEPQQKLGTQQGFDESRTRSADEDERGEIADEDRAQMDGDRTRRIADETRIRWIADEELREAKHRQENTEQTQHENTPAKNDHDRKIARLPALVPVSPPDPELDIRLATTLVSSPEPPPRLADHRSYSLTKITPARSLVPRSQHARLPSFQHVLSQTRPPRSQFCFLRTQIRFPRSQYIFSQTRFPRTQHKREKTLRTTRCPQLSAVSCRSRRSLIMELFVPPPRKRRHRTLAASGRLADRCHAQLARQNSQKQCHADVNPRLPRLLCRSITAHTTKATSILSSDTGTLTTTELLTARTRPLAKREKDLVVTRTHAARSCSVFVTDLARRFASTVCTHHFQPRAFRHKTEVADFCRVMYFLRSSQACEVTKFDCLKNSTVPPLPKKRENID